jgi:hypothetical protein
MADTKTQSERTRDYRRRLVADRAALRVRIAELEAELADIRQLAAKYRAVMEARHAALQAQLAACQQSAPLSAEDIRAAVREAVSAALDARQYGA